MKTLIQTIMAIPIAEQIGKAFGRKSLLGTGAELMSARLVLRSFGAMLALGAVAGGLSWLAGRQHGSGTEDADSGSTGSRKQQRGKGRSGKREKAAPAQTSGS